MASTTLEAIQTKVRRLTRSPSEAQLSTDDLNDYINTAVLYDFPEELRLFNLRQTYTFFCEPYVDTYEAGDGVLDADFNNTHITIHPPVYIAGYEAWYSQSREQFFAAYPMINTIATQATGDGVTTAFSGTLSSVPVIANQVLFSSVDSSNGGLTLSDDGAGALTGDGTGTINYVTGAYTLSFSTAPAADQPIKSQTVPYVAQRPMAMMFFENKITLRPIPDQPYRVNFEVFKQPTELLDDDQSPELKEWFQYISYLAALKVFQDKQDLDSVALIMPELKRQERLILRRTLVQNSNERTSTIYSETNQQGGWGWFGGFFNN